MQIYNDLKSIAYINGVFIALGMKTNYRKYQRVFAFRCYLHFDNHTHIKIMIKNKYKEQQLSITHSYVKIN